MDLDPPAEGMGADSSVASDDPRSDGSDMAPLNEDENDRREEGNRWLRELIQSVIDHNNHRWRKVLWSVAVGYFILVIGIGFALYSIEQRDKERADKAISKAQ